MATSFLQITGMTPTAYRRQFTPARDGNSFRQAEQPPHSGHKSRCRKFAALIRKIAEAARGNLLSCCRRYWRRSEFALSENQNVFQARRKHEVIHSRIAAAAIASLCTCGLARADDFFMGSDVSLISWSNRRNDVR